ncbi:hypothetical protein B0H14DRAFT_3162410 [Mycena olivaceomarginata]|nr:hypothetical protein B0H14DRAFT_3162410 [Mycena olivaceomarginata]
MPKANRHKDGPGRLFRAAIPTPKPATTPVIPTLKRKYLLQRPPASIGAKIGSHNGLTSSRRLTMRSRKHFRNTPFQGPMGY